MNVRRTTLRRHAEECKRHMGVRGISTNEAITILASEFNLAENGDLPIKVWFDGFVERDIDTKEPDFDAISDGRGDFEKEEVA